MYTTIEAELENGRVKSPELQRFPAVARVMITWLRSSVEKKNYDFSGLAGRLKWRGDAVKEQRELRDEW